MLYGERRLGWSSIASVAASSPAMYALIDGFVSCASCARSRAMRIDTSDGLLRCDTCAAEVPCTAVAVLAAEIVIGIGDIRERSVGAGPGGGGSGGDASVGWWYCVTLSDLFM